MKQQMENIKQQLEQIIESNLPEKKEINDDSQTDNEVLYTDWLYDRGFNQAISQIDTSLIADEVLKVVRQIIEDKIKFQKEVLPSSYETGYTHALEDLLSTLSPNKENKNNG